MSDDRIPFRHERPDAGDDALDHLFALAMTPQPADDAAAERALTRWRGEERRKTRRTFTAWTSGLLAAAAMLGALVYVDTRALPTTAAYDAYVHASGDGW